MWYIRYALYTYGTTGSSSIKLIIIDRAHTHTSFSRNFLLHTATAAKSTTTEKTWRCYHTHIQSFALLLRNAGKYDEPNVIRNERMDENNKELTTFYLYFMHKTNTFACHFCHAFRFAWLYFHVVSNIRAAAFVQNKCESCVFEY